MSQQPELLSPQFITQISGSLVQSCTSMPVEEVKEKTAETPNSDDSQQLFTRTDMKDKSIIATAIPNITNEFHSIDDIAWYGSAYMLANASTQLLFGRIYKFYSTKWIYIGAVVLFQLGSTVCGAAPSSTALIVGRALAGAGSSGIISGSMLILMHLIPLHKRPVIFSAFGTILSLGQILGPLLGGAFTQRLSWRWCFFINLPFGAIAVLVIVLVLKPDPPTEKGTSLRQQIEQLDPLSSIVQVGCVVCLLLALQWGGVVYSWSNGRIIALLVLFGVLLVVFVSLQAWKKEKALLPPRIASQRSVAAGFIFGFCGAAALMVLTYYLPIFLQAVKGVNPITSGLMTLPFVIGSVIAAISAGIVTQKLGYYVPAMIAGPLLAAIGAGLLTTFTTSTGHTRWIGYQFLFGLGIGMGMQQTNLAIQTVLPKEDVPIGTGLVFFSQQLGGAVFLAVGQNVFFGKLIKNLTGIDGIDAAQILQTGATDLRSIVPADELPQVLKGYSSAITSTWYIAVAMTCAQLLAGSAMEWRSVKKDQVSKSRPDSEA